MVVAMTVTVPMAVAVAVTVTVTVTVTMTMAMVVTVTGGWILAFLMCCMLMVMMLKGVEMSAYSMSGKEETTPYLGDGVRTLHADR